MANRNIRFRCNTCEGEYNNADRNSVQYFHACPPIHINDDELEDRPEKRDENVRAGQEGRGRTIIN